MKNARANAIVSWLLGICIGLIVFLTLGVGILFAFTYSAMHGSMGDGTTGVFVLIAIYVFVVGMCGWLAVAIKRSVLRRL